MDNKGSIQKEKNGEKVVSSFNVQEKKKEGQNSQKLNKGIRQFYIVTIGIFLLILLIAMAFFLKHRTHESLKEEVLKNYEFEMKERYNGYLSFNNINYKNETQRKEGYANYADNQFEIAMFNLGNSNGEGRILDEQAINTAIENLCYNKLQKAYEDQTPSKRIIDIGLPPTKTVDIKASYLESCRVKALKSGCEKRICRILDANQFSHLKTDKFYRDRKVDYDREKYKNFTLFEFEGEPQKSVDWRPYLPPVKDQGPFQTCWIISMLTSLEGLYYFVLDKEPTRSFSETVYLSCRKLQTLGGLELTDQQIRDELKQLPVTQGNRYYTMTYASLLWDSETLPFTYNDINFITEFDDQVQNFQFASSDCKNKNPLRNLINNYDKCVLGNQICEDPFKFEKYFRPANLFNTIPANNKRQMELAVNIAPVSVVLTACDYFAMKNHGAGIFLQEPQDCEDQTLSHAVTVVGYGEEEDPADSTKTIEYWLVRNSYSTSWGENGYIKLAKGEEDVTWDNGQCGILTRPLFPQVTYRDMYRDQYSRPACNRVGMNC